MFTKVSGCYNTVVLLCAAAIASPAPGVIDQKSLSHIANVSYAVEDSILSETVALFSPRMDFDQWKPLTGRGDPLRNDPTYDYEPPVLERVRYWADDTRLEREHYPERKSEVLMLGITSRKPSVPSRPPSLPPKKHHRPLISKYEDFALKLNEHYPMTILVPPPPPPPGHKPTLFVLTEEKSKLPEPVSETFNHITTTSIPEKISTLYAFQESNLIYQSSTTGHAFIPDNNKPALNYAFSSEYAGWGPTTPLNEADSENDTYNFIIHEYHGSPKHQYSFYKPMFSESPPNFTPNLLLSTISPEFLPTALPATNIPKKGHMSTTETVNQITTEKSSSIETSTEHYFVETTKQPQEIQLTHEFIHEVPVLQHSTNNVIDMLRPMMTMPLVNGPDRAEDNLYAHATENMQIFKDYQTNNKDKLETMQTMQPPPVILPTPKIHHKPEANIEQVKNLKPLVFNTQNTNHTYFTLTTSTPLKRESTSEVITSTTESPKYLIIQGHSKVKTYSSKFTNGKLNDIQSKDITKPNETNEVKHLHPLKDKTSLVKDMAIRRSRAQNLKSVVNLGLGSIEIQEADVGIKYDVSDGSKVPVEIYRKGIVDNDVNDSYNHANKKEKRLKRQIDLDDLLPFDEEAIEEYIFNYLKGKRNETGITGLIAKVVTSDAASAADELEDNDEDR